MTGFCGWSNLNSGNDPLPGDLQQMCRHIPPLGDVTEECNSDTHAVALTSQVHGNLYRSDDLVVVVDGKPVFTHPVAIDKTASEDNPHYARQVAKLYQTHGTQYIQHVGGEFALAIIDIKKNRTLLAVDRIGIRPLAYGEVNNHLVFGSTATSVYAHAGLPRGLDHQSIFNYVYFHMIPSPRTIFQAVKKLPAAHQLVFAEGKMTCERYWLPNYNWKSKREIKDQLLPTLRGAVERASIDPNTGAFLSGGLDSSTVAGLLQQGSHKKSRVFNIGFEQEGFDELEFARMATQHFGLDLTNYYITPEDVRLAMPEVARNYDEPFGNSSAVPTLVCARLAKEAGITTLLAGDGGDEIFGGNERYTAQKVFSYYDRVPRWIDKAVFKTLFFRESVKKKSSGFQHKVRRYIEQANMPMPDRTQDYNLMQMLGATNIFTGDFLKSINTDEPLELIRKEYWQEGPPDQLERMLLSDYKFTLADTDLRKVNRMCELAGVQVRYPMLDDQVVAYANSIPSHVKVKGRVLRSFFKSEVKNFLPAPIINKTKQGFGLPFGDWLKQDQQLSDHVTANIESLRGRDVFESAFMDNLLHKHQHEHAAYYGSLVWVFAILEEWLQQHDLSI